MVISRSMHVLGLISKHLISKIKINKLRSNLMFFITLCSFGIPTVLALYKISNVKNFRCNLSSKKMTSISSRKICVKIVHTLFQIYEGKVLLCIKKSCIAKNSNRGKKKSILLVEQCSNLKRASLFKNYIIQ